MKVTETLTIDDRTIKPPMNRYFKLKVDGWLRDGVLYAIDNRINYDVFISSGEELISVQMYHNKTELIKGDLFELTQLNKANESTTQPRSNNS